MRRCFDLAAKGLGNTYPNPLVGSVIVHRDVIIGEGWHQQAGQAHAEVNAINSVKNKNLLQESTLYVSLEPCNHFGKTPPCANLIVEHKIPRVVIGTVDPFKQVNGNGIATLQKAEVEVIMSSLKEEAIHLNRRFFTLHQKQRPYIILKWAQSNDGFLAPLPEKRTSKSPVFLSTKEDQILVHQWRKQEEAILVGAQTVIDDNPQLTTRWIEGQHPIRVIVDPNQRIPKEAAVFSNHSTTFPLSYQSLGLKKDRTPQEFLADCLRFLAQKNISSVIVEGGKKTLDYFIEASLWDEARIFKSTVQLKEGIPAPGGIFLENPERPGLVILQQQQKQL